MKPAVPASSTKPNLTRRAFLRLGIAAPVVAVGAFGWSRFVEPDWIQISRHDVQLLNLPREFDGFRLAHITDLHVGDPSMSYDLNALCDLVSAQNADAIVITGDFISRHRAGFEQELVPGLRRLKAREGAFGILGNHDFWGGKPDLVASAIESANVRELRNSVHTFTRGDSKFHLAGIDDFWHGAPDISGTANQVPTGEACVVLGHEPDFALEVAPTGKFGLMLAGHSHGGQIAWPTGKPIHLPPHCRLFPRGWYDVGAMKLYTNRGIGTVGFPLRFCARPEIAVFTLRV